MPGGRYTTTVMNRHLNISFLNGVGLIKKREISSAYGTSQNRDYCYHDQTRLSYLQEKAG